MTLALRYYELLAHLSLLYKVILLPNYQFEYTLSLGSLPLCGRHLTHFGVNHARPLGNQRRVKSNNQRRRTRERRILRQLIASHRRLATACEECALSSGRNFEHPQAGDCNLVFHNRGYLTWRFRNDLQYSLYPKI